MAGVQNELESVMSVVQSQQSAPSFVPAQGNNSNTSTITIDRTHRELMEQQNKSEHLERTIDDLKKQLAAQPSSSTAPTYTSNSTQAARAPDVRVKHTDGKGQPWCQVVHYCSRHGYTHNHDNAGCRDKQAPIKKPGQKPWQPGATHLDHKNGGTLHQDKCMHWVQPATNQCSPTPPL